MQQAIIIHGGTTFKDYDEYLIIVKTVGSFRIAAALAA